MFSNSFLKGQIVAVFVPAYLHILFKLNYY